MRFGLKEETIRAIQGVLAKHPQVETAILYGSRAKGNYRPGSDIDLTLKGEELTLDVIHRIGWEIDDLLLPYLFDISVYAQIDNPDLIGHIDQVGVTFYQKEPQ